MQVLADTGTENVARPDKGPHHLEALLTRSDSW